MTIVIGNVATINTTYLQVSLFFMVTTFGVTTFLQLWYVPFLRLYLASIGGFHKWGYPKIDGLCHGKSQSNMDDMGVVTLFQEISKCHAMKYRLVTIGIPLVNNVNYHHYYLRKPPIVIPWNTGWLMVDTSLMFPYNYKDMSLFYNDTRLIFGGFLSHRGTPVIIHVRLGFS